MTSRLFSPFEVRGQTYANRIAISPMAQYNGDDGAVTPWHDQHLGGFAVSGPGVVMIESTSVEREGWGSATCLALHTDRQEAALRELLTRIRTYSATPFGIQFGHSGRKGSGRLPTAGRGPLPLDEGGWRTWGPSPVSFGGEWPVPEALDDAGLARVREAYRQAAGRVNRVDLGLVELHGAHGYLLHTFLSPVSNHREDRYGGSLAARTAFVAEIIADVRRTLTDDRALGIRLNAHDYVDGGLTFEDTIAITGLLREAGADYVCVSAGAISAEARIEASPGYLVPYASKLRAATGIATFVTGLILTPEQGEEIIADGHADMVALARGVLDDPRWSWHAAERLGVEADYPMPYLMAKPGRWPGAALLRPADEAA
ncbi:oxidoreductase [Acuticoccus mangrovi]|uniref:Oxidoreductase n=1 Tax=Acuticoccus mangrovi TaxID=2796142 RepID=A0A934IT51_9HYPH|nr:oxidoreductase [Acuticoccus mangrovi]